MWHCLGLLEAGLSPPAPRDHEEQALWSCCCSCLTSLLRICHLSLVWVLTSHSWGPGSSIRASTPQGPPCHTVTALLRDQDKVLLLAPVFSHGYVQASFVIALGNTVLPLWPREEFPAWGMWAGSAVFGSYSPSGVCILPSSSPLQTDAGA